MLIQMRMVMSNWLIKHKTDKKIEHKSYARNNKIQIYSDFVADVSPSSHCHEKSLMRFFPPFCVSSSLTSCLTSSEPYDRT